MDEDSTPLLDGLDDLPGMSDGHLPPTDLESLISNIPNWPDEGPQEWHDPDATAEPSTTVIEHEVLDATPHSSGTMGNLTIETISLLQQGTSIIDQQMALFRDRLGATLNVKPDVLDYALPKMGSPLIYPVAALRTLAGTSKPGQMQETDQLDHDYNEIVPALHALFVPVDKRTDEEKQKVVDLRELIGKTDLTRDDIRKQALVALAMPHEYVFCMQKNESTENDESVYKHARQVYFGLLRSLKTHHALTATANLAACLPMDTSRVSKESVAILSNSAEEFSTPCMVDYRYLIQDLIKRENDARSTYAGSDEKFAIFMIALRDTMNTPMINKNQFSDVVESVEARLRYFSKTAEARGVTLENGSKGLFYGVPNHEDMNAICPGSLDLLKALRGGTWPADFPYVPNDYSNTSQATANRALYLLSAKNDIFSESDPDQFIDRKTVSSALMRLPNETLEAMIPDMTHPAIKSMRLHDIATTLSPELSSSPAIW